MQSHPINPEAPSLLTTIPGEVRNAIFEALFDLGHPITISRDRYAYGYSSCYQSRDVRGIALLRTCRQIHEEITGILYSRNIFCLSLADDPYNAEPIPWAMNWLVDIGRPSSAVRHLQIYIDNVFHGADDVINISPILHQAWKPDRAALKVELLPRWSVEEGHPPGDDVNRTAEMNAVSCNRQMATIIDDPSGMIKRFCSVPSLLREVYLNFLDHYAHLHYYQATKSDGGLLSMDTIDIVENGAESTFSKRIPITDIKRIMSCCEIRNTILTMALCPDDGIIFDLTNRTTNVDVGYIASVTTYLTGTHEIDFWERAFSVTVTSMSTLAAFTAELKILRGLPLGSPTNITIRYYLEIDASLDDVQFDALALLHATGSNCLLNPIRIEVYSEAGTAPIKSYTISLEDIRQSVLLFIYQIFKKTPEHMPAQLPRIWMSGRGEAREAEWDLSKCSIEPIVNENVGISSTIVQSRYEDILGMLKSMLTPGNLPPDSMGDFATRFWY